MKVLLPIDTSQDIEFIPRVYPTGALTLDIYDETSQVTTAAVANSYVTTDGIVTISFTFDFTSGYKYQFTIKEGADVIYRGKIQITSQTPQDFKQTDGYYRYI